MSFRCSASRCFGRPRMVIVGSVAGLIALLALAGCGRPSAGAPAVATVAPTPTSTPAFSPGPQLTWRNVNAPSQFSDRVIHYTVAPSNGAVVYGCVGIGPAHPGSVEAIVSSDGGAHWTSGATITPPGAVSFCAIAVDASNAQTLTLTISDAPNGAPPDLDTDTAYISFDSGASWRALPGHAFITQLASFQGRIFVAGEGATAQSPDVRGMWTSDDQLLSWRPLNVAAASPNPMFWLNPHTGALLVTSSPAAGGTVMAFSDDSGAHWTTRTLPQDISAAGSLIAAPQVAGAQWLICAAAANIVECSRDEGQTWAQLPSLNLSELSPKGFTFTQGANVFAIAADGSVLASVLATNGGEMLFRLPAGAQRWQSLGPFASDSTVVYVSAPGDGVLWSSLRSAATPYTTASLP